MKIVDLVLTLVRLGQYNNDAAADSLPCEAHFRLHAYASRGP
jgi:hypothetical protein